MAIKVDFINTAVTARRIRIEAIRFDLGAITLVCGRNDAEASEPRTEAFFRQIETIGFEGYRWSVRYQDIDDVEHGWKAAEFLVIGMLPSSCVSQENPDLITIGYRVGGEYKTYTFEKKE